MTSDIRNTPYFNVLYDLYYKIGKKENEKIILTKKKYNLCQTK